MIELQKFAKKSKGKIAIARLWHRNTNMNSNKNIEILVPSTCEFHPIGCIVELTENVCMHL